jgi:hypothetical protein
MRVSLRFFPVAVLVVILLSLSSQAQTPAHPPTYFASQEQGQLPAAPPGGGASDQLINEIALLRKSLQTLNLRLQEISAKVAGTGSTPAGSPNDKQNRIAANLEILTRAEQRAEALRKELLERTERETSLKTRLMQIDEDSRPENIERALNPIGTTRTAELRDVRRRTYENDRQGIDRLLSLTVQARQRLEEDVRQADALVTKLRQRILPLIDREIEKLNPN